MSRWTLLLVLLLGLVSGDAFGAAPDPRHLDATGVGGRVDLSHNWLYAPGDDPRYATPSFDDSRWKVIASEQDGASYVESPFCWYRLHATLPPNVQNLAISLQYVIGAYEVYVNGVRIGGLGDMASHSYQLQMAYISYPIPENALSASPADLVLAFRFSNHIGRYQDSSFKGPLFAAAVFLQNQEASKRDASYAATHMEQVLFVSDCLYLLIGLISLALFFAMRSRGEYLAIGIWCLTVAASGGMTAWKDLGTITVPKTVFGSLFWAISQAAFVEFVRLILGVPRTRWWVIMEGAVILSMVTVPLIDLGWIPSPVSAGSDLVIVLIRDVILPLLLLRALLRGNVDARVLLPAALLGSISAYYALASFTLYELHIRSSSSFAQIPGFQIGSYRMGISDLSNFGFSITILLFLVLRTIRIVRERAEAAAEIAAAQTTQQLLLARASEPTPGFTVESVYHPASEVGGDFFLVSPGPDGSLIAIVGDVSGKGLIAAMRVSMILGVLRREDSRQPAAILDRLNQALLSQGEMGFTTACCVRLEHTGGYTIANAGHISPYSNGLEIATSPGLPLGLTSQSEYETVSGAIHAGEKLVLMSDGVVEARSPKGELYGFDRLPALTRMNADEIANTAQRFGQEDDITVLTIACCL